MSVSRLILLVGQRRRHMQVSGIEFEPMVENRIPPVKAP